MKVKMLKEEVLKKNKLTSFNPKINYIRAKKRKRKLTFSSLKMEKGAMNQKTEVVLEGEVFRNERNKNPLKPLAGKKVLPTL